MKFKVVWADQANKLIEKSMYLGEFVVCNRQENETQKLTIDQITKTIGSN